MPRRRAAEMHAALERVKQNCGRFARAARWDNELYLRPRAQVGRCVLTEPHVQSGYSFVENAVAHQEAGLFA